MSEDNKIVQFIKKASRILPRNPPYFQIREGDNKITGTVLPNGKDLVFRFFLVGFDMLAITITRQNVEKLRDWLNREYPPGEEVTNVRSIDRLPISSDPANPIGKPPGSRK